MFLTVACVVSSYHLVEHVSKTIGGDIMIDLSTIIMGVATMSDLIYRLKGLKSNKEKALISLDKVIADRRGIACRISISNIGDKPFSIIDVFINQNEHRFSGLAVRDVGARHDDVGGGIYTLKADMVEVSFIVDEKTTFNLDAFDFDTFLQPNQAETGWIIFAVEPKDLMFSSMGIKISGETEIFQTFDD